MEKFNTIFNEKLFLAQIPCKERLRNTLNTLKYIRTLTVLQINVKQGRLNEIYFSN